MLIGISLVMASACVVNNVIDVDIDAKMARTDHRALVTGAIKKNIAIIYGVILGVLGFAALIYWTNWLVVVIGLVGFVDYTVLYGYFKRKSIHGTIVGSISGATPPIAGFCAVTGTFGLEALILFLILVIWQMPHFYAIAIFRLKDYKNAKIPVLPLVKGISKTKKAIFLYIIAFVIATLSLTIFGYTGYVYAAIMIILGIVWLKLAYHGFGTTDDVGWAKNIFKASLIILMIFCLTISLNFFLI
jgi:protoheme IX farnesyltransferase